MWRDFSASNLKSRLRMRIVNLEHDSLRWKLPPSARATGLPICLVREWKNCGTNRNSRDRRVHKANTSVVIRHCHSLAEYEEGVRIEQLIWGGDITVPAPIFVVADHTGGQVLGAFDGEKMVGLTLALAGIRGS